LKKEHIDQRISGDSTRGISQPKLSIFRKGKWKKVKYSSTTEGKQGLRITSLGNPSGSTGFSALAGMKKLGGLTSTPL